MSIPVCRVKGKITRVSGEPLAGAVVRAHLERVVILTPAVIIEDKTSVSDLGGNVEFDLWINQGFEPPVSYTITIKLLTGAMYVHHDIIVPNQSEITLEELLGAPPPASGIPWAGGISWYPNINWK